LFIFGKILDNLSKKQLSYQAADDQKNKSKHCLYSTLIDFMESGYVQAGN